MVKFKNSKVLIQILKLSIIKKLQFLCLSILFVGHSPWACAQQDFTYWNNLVGYDGVSPWEGYLTYSPEFLGPNALPVPHSHRGLGSQEYQWDDSVDYYFAKGDKTYDWFTRLYIPLGAGRVAFEGFYVPYEYYETSPEIRDKRRARSQEGKGFAAGDVYISTIIQLARNHKKLPDMALNLSLRTASGTKLKDARFTDAPGYYFALSFSKAFKRGNVTLRPHGLIGFYVWQTYDVKYRQNDAIQFGGGIDVKKNSFSLKQSLGAYAGYLGNGDFPMVYSAQFEKTFEHVKLISRYQYGIRDYPFQGIRLGLIWYLSKKIKKI